jgi:hypothetical protein
MYTIGHDRGEGISKKKVEKGGRGDVHGVKRAPVVRPIMRLII